MRQKRVLKPSVGRVIWSSTSGSVPENKAAKHTLYALFQGTGTTWQYKFLLDAPINTPPPVTWREWLSWKFGNTFNEPDGRYFKDAQAFRRKNGLSENHLSLVVDPSLFETDRVNGWSLQHSPQAKAHRYLRGISDRFGPMKDHNHPNLRLDGVVLQTFPSCLNGWVAAYGVSLEAVKNVASALLELKENTLLEVVH